MKVVEVLFFSKPILSLSLTSGLLGFISLSSYEKLNHLNC